MGRIHSDREKAGPGKPLLQSSEIEDLEFKSMVVKFKSNGISSHYVGRKQAKNGLVVPVPKMLDGPISL